MANSAAPNNTPEAGSDGQAMPSPRSRLTPATVLTVIGCCCVVLGGLVAAVTGPLDWARGSWLAAHLVLVCGVAQYAMGHARTWYPEGAQRRGGGWAQIGAWNLGNAVVIGGTLASEPLVVDLGSMLLVIALAIALHTARPRAARSAVERVSPLVGWAYRTLLVVLVVSIPTGMVPSHGMPDGTAGSDYRAASQTQPSGILPACKNSASSLAASSVRSFSACG